MTQKEIEDKRYECLSAIADKVRDIQGFAIAMKSADDRNRIQQNSLKIRDCLDDIQRYYGKIDDLALEIPDEDNDEDNGFLIHF